MRGIASGWDIGGVHLKQARLLATPEGPRLDWRLRPFEIWREPARLEVELARLEPAGPLAVTLTAELSDVFSDRGAGVRAVLDAVTAARGGDDFAVLDVEGRLLPCAAAREVPHAVASANWVAPATVAARRLAEGLAVDVGSTTTDIVPFRGGRPAPAGRSDRERLATGELVYTGVLRTPPAALAETVPLPGGPCRTIPEHFTQMADAYLLLGRLREEEYTVATPDGRGRSRSECAARLGRLVGADPGEIGDEALVAIARFLMERQADRIAAALRAVAPAPRCPAVVCGAGRFLAEEAARRAGLPAVPIEDLLPGYGPGWGTAAPAAALALLAAGAA
jgi:probable H4MPT-linked C1 transfer pathway protein